MYLNTYQLEPLVKFHEASVLKAAEEILDELFGDHKYNQHVIKNPILHKFYKPHSDTLY